MESLLTLGVGNNNHSPPQQQKDPTFGPKLHTRMQSFEHFNEFFLTKMEQQVSEGLMISNKFSNSENSNENNNSDSLSKKQPTTPGSVKNTANSKDQDPQKPKDPIEFSFFLEDPTTNLSPSTYPRSAFRVLMDKILEGVFSLPIVEPLSCFHLLCDFLSLALIGMNFFVIPFEISFKIENGHSLIQHLNGLTYLLFLEIICKFRAEYYEFGSLVTHSRKIIAHYLSSYFLPDMIALGFVLFSQNPYLKLIFFLKVPYFSNLMQKYLDLVFFTDFSYKIGKILIFFIKLAILVNFIACFWYLLASSSPNQVTWLSKTKPQSTYFDLYLISLYWVIGFFTMKPDFTSYNPSNVSEYCFCIFLQILGLFFLFYSFHELKHIISSQNKEKTLRCLKKIGKFQGVSVLGNDKIMKSIRYFDENMIENEIFLKLNNQFRQKFIAQEFFQILNGKQFFKSNFQPSFLKKLAETVTIAQFWPGERIFSTLPNEDKCMYFLKKGNVEIQRPSPNFSAYSSSKFAEHAIYTLQENEMLGLMEFFADENILLDAKSKSFSVLYQIRKTDFVDLVSENKKDYEKYCLIRDKLNVYQDFEIFNTHCFLCGSPCHYSSQCPKYHYIPQKRLVVFNHIHSPTQKRGTFKRRIVKKKFKPLRNLARLIQGVNLIMNKREFDDFFEAYDAIFEKENEKYLESGFMDDSDKDSNKENSSKSKSNFNSKAPLFNTRINTNPDPDLNTSNETIFSNLSNVSPQSRKDGTNSPSNKSSKKPSTPTRKNSQSRSFLKQPETQQNSRHLSMISLNPAASERKKTIESSFLDSSGNNTIKSKALEDIMEDPLLENDKPMIPSPKQQQHRPSLNPPQGFERSLQIHHSISTFRSDTSQLLQPPGVNKGDYDGGSSQSFTRLNLNMFKCDTDNSGLPSFVNLKSNNLLEKNDNANKNRDRSFNQLYQVGQNPPSLYLTNANANASNNSFTSSNEKKNQEFFLSMDVCGEFDVYLPHNNCNYVVEHLTKSKRIVKTMSTRNMKMGDDIEIVSQSPTPGAGDRKKKTAHFFNKA